MPNEFLVPHPSALIQSMRSIGYRPATALADLVDNSISARAKNIQIELKPATGLQFGWIRVEDDGLGMSREELINALRWGRDQKGPKRAPHDLGRFGLGLKTASFSMGRRLTVVTSNGKETSACRWDLDHIETSGKWELQEGIHEADSPLISFLESRKNGTTILISNVDRVRLKNAADSSAPMLRDITEHLGLVFHRFLKAGAKGVTLRVGNTSIQPLNLLTTESKTTEELTVAEENLAHGTVRLRTVIMPTYRMLASFEYEKLKGPRGWLAHQGFFIYRGDRLIVPGGWLGFFAPEEHHKLARIIVDIPNDQDEQWGLNVAKSKVSPPATLRADLERIALAAKQHGIQRYRMHGEKVAPQEELEDELSTSSRSVTAFWIQSSKAQSVNFKINRAHPLIHALYAAVKNNETVNAFMKAFEKLLPISAILQNPCSTTNGLDAELSASELDEMTSAAKLVKQIFCDAGDSSEKATEMTLSCQPFLQYKSVLIPRLR